MTEIINGDFKQLEKEDFISVSEPTCGSGVMILAFAQNMLKKEINYQNSVLLQLCLIINSLKLQLYSIKLTYYNQRHHPQSILGTKKDASAFTAFASFHFKKSLFIQFSHVTIYNSNLIHRPEWDPKSLPFQHEF